MMKDRVKHEKIKSCLIGQVVIIFHFCTFFKFIQMRKLFKREFDSKMIY